MTRNHYDHTNGSIECPHCKAEIDSYDRFKVELDVLSWNGTTFDFNAECPHCDRLLRVLIHPCFPMSDDDPSMWRGSFQIEKALTATDKKYLKQARAAA